ncbi:MAG: NAD(+)/NADH kinase [Candidatus Bathyarchaeota archaeon]|nr:NAD(+)/NADH kinase [Candidatus Bathyarchaeota archaeon]
MRVGVVSRTDKPEAIDIVRYIIGHIEPRGVKVLVETDTALAMEIPGKNVDLGEMNADLVVTVGGDGTIMRTAMLMHDPATPILGVNMGSRGFLTEVMPRDLGVAFDRILEGDYALEECVKLSSRCLGMEGAFPDSLNEVLIASSLPSKMLDLRLAVDGERFLDIQADGAMVAPPTGSTAYNLSAGGSILAPGVEAMILTTICPYSYFRSIVVPTTSRITIELLKPKVDALAIIDGREYTAIKPGSVVEVWKSEHKARFVRFRPFYKRLGRRLTFRRVQDAED